MEKKSEKGTIALILGFIKRMQEDHIGAYAAQAAYFLIMSFIPFLLMVWICRMHWQDLPLLQHLPFQIFLSTDRFLKYV